MIALPARKRKNKPASKHRVQLLDSYHGVIDIPPIHTLDDFRKWVHSGVLPEKLKVHFFDGLVCVESAMEEFDSHNLVKGALAACLFNLMDDESLGRFCSDGMMLTNEAANLGTEPDGMVILNASRAAGRIRLRAGQKRKGKATELVGTPDIVIEVMSPSSLDKDLRDLKSKYHRAGIPEYWLIDARGEAIDFKIYARTEEGYQLQPRSGGWTRSRVLNREFRFNEGQDEFDYYFCRLIFR